MQKNFLGRIMSIIICIALVIGVLPVTASADIGPKEFINISFENLGDTPCFGTLLSSTKGAGPGWSEWDGTAEKDYHLLETDQAISARYADPENYQENPYNEKAQNAFYIYTDPDGYHFVQVAWDVQASGGIVWDYFPPNPFKILLYFPETDSFAVSEIIEDTAFYSYYTVDLADLQIDSVVFNKEISKDEEAVQAEAIKAVRKENITWELYSFALRVLSTILIEMAIAYLFGFREKRQLLLLTAVNILTQIILNLLLNKAYYIGYPWYGFFFYYAVTYFLYEFVVFAVEAVFYCIFMSKISVQPKKKRFYVLYAFIANAASFGIGLIASQLIPDIFH